jgi:hypothetical protein
LDDYGVFASSPKEFGHEVARRDGRWRGVELTRAAHR